MADRTALHPPPRFRTDPAAGWTRGGYSDRAMEPTRRAAIAAPFAVLAAPRAPRAQAAVITGSATYRERIALRPGSVLEVELVDTAPAGAPAAPIAAARIAVQGQVLIRFELPYDPARIDPRGRYALRARLMQGEEVAFRGERIHPPLAEGAGRGGEILLLRAEGGAAAGPVGPQWVAEDIGGRGALDRLQSSITFGADGRAYGSGGCNRFTGGYALDGAALRFGAMASTNMACVPAAMDQERRFHEALAAVRGWRIENGILHLTGEGGATVLRLSRRS